MIKVNVISGFLGAGKTTLIRHLAAALAENNERVVILENEFGKVGIDGKLLGHEGLSVIEISSGCICCTLKHDFMTALLSIAEDFRPDRILIEPSGIFVLSEMYDIFNNPQINSKLNLCSAFTVIDCINFLKQREHYGYFFENQIRYADKLILSKIKGISKDTLIKIMEELQGINPGVEIFSGEWSNMDNKDFLSLLHVQKHASALEKVQLNNAGSSHHTHGDHNFTAFGLVPQFNCSKAKLSEKLATLAKGTFGTLIRAKGHVNSEKGILEFNYVDGIYEIKEITHNIEPSVCFIGEDLDKAGISMLFEE
ncbi:CobW family GTP-binding protein [Acetivibrio clariflavus]|uniref:Putative GTPase, G3E family n=1 Tax=Acetivibrio clariflavus (strain DSM 19732 / NBRC 101661 / EBR45) TaxID=720554 RepID=G8LVC8_ACECE|nr:GTP-binding protein [Acetivibrio clariflavus]AEV67482.1 putative GTPase, G3E family [Acetivibrio clariflavus DSM 19732]